MYIFKNSQVNGKSVFSSVKKDGYAKWVSLFQDKGARNYS